MAARELTRPPARDEAPIPHSKRLHLNAVRNADSGLLQPPRRAVLTLPPPSSCLGSPARPPNSATAMASHVGGRLRICGAEAPRKPSCELGTRGPSFLICRAADSPQALIRGPSPNERQEWVDYRPSLILRRTARSRRLQTFAKADGAMSVGLRLVGSSSARGPHGDRDTGPTRPADCITPGWWRHLATR